MCLSPKVLLLIHEAKQKFLFQGSPTPLEKLTPKQYYNERRETGERYKDGNVCVTTTDTVYIAMFRALTHPLQFASKEGWYGTHFGKKNGKIDLKAAPKVIEELKKGMEGYVHIFDRENFLKSVDREWEWRSEKEVEPLYTVKVSSKDLPIELIMEF